MIDCGWEENLRIYDMYGQSGGNKSAKNTTECIVDIIREECTCEEHIPTLIMADFNATPCSL